MPKYKVLTMKGEPIMGISVHDHATGKAASIKPDADGNFGMDRAQARLVAQGSLVRALDGEGLIAGTKAISLFSANEGFKIPAAPAPAVTKEILIARGRDELVKTAEALAINLDSDARREQRKNDYSAAEIADKILSQVARFDAAKDRVLQQSKELSSYGKR